MDAVDPRLAPRGRAAPKSSATRRACSALWNSARHGSTCLVARTEPWPRSGDGAPAPPARRGGRGRLRHGDLLSRRAGDRGVDVRDASVRRAGFHRVVASQAQEVFLDGHVRVRTLRRRAGPHPLRQLEGGGGARGSRSDRGRSLRGAALHYGFDSFFCQPGIDGAHEKGGVEGEVGRFRRRHLVPVPRVASMAELNELVAAGDDATTLAISGVGP